MVLPAGSASGFCHQLQYENSHRDRAVAGPGSGRVAFPCLAPRAARRVLSVALANSNVAESAQPTTESPSIPSGFSLDTEVLRYEGSLIRRALEESGGSVTRAARLLGVTHQGLAFILNGRHSDLSSIRTPVKRRRRSIIRHH